MDQEKIIVGAILMGMGFIFFFNNKTIGKGAYQFYRRLYTEKNLIIMFKAAGVILIVGGLIIMFIDK